MGVKPRAQGPSLQIIYCVCIRSVSYIIQEEFKMLAKRIIPCLDMKEGRVVKGTQFVDLRDAGDPVENAKMYDEQGADEIAFLDITASYEKRDILIDIVRRTAEEIFIPLTVGGGIKRLEDIRKLLKAGADKVSINTAAVRDRRFVERASKRFGSQCVVIAIDAKRKDGGWEVFTHGGRVSTGIDALLWARQMEELGAGEILLTSMDRDGTKDGYDIELTGRFHKAWTSLSLPPEESERWNIFTRDSFRVKRMPSSPPRSFITTNSRLRR